MTARRHELEWPTFLLIFLVYAGLAALIWLNAVLAWWIILPAGAYLAALHVSLQHEVLHGHPTGSRRLNEALVFLTPHFWLPYPRYRDSHLKHHNDADLTDPRRDPESYYMLPEDWAGLGGVRQALYRLNHTLAGRMIMGPAISIVRMWSTDFAAIGKGDGEIAGAWVYHVAACGLTIWLVAFVAGMPLWQYMLLISYPGISLALVRSYCEHRAADAPEHRTIIVEASPFWALLFLNNNLHVAHHDRPALAWYKIPAHYRAERDRMLAENDGYTMNGYGEIFRRYLFSAKEPIAYPRMDWLRPD
ncbi:MAG: fatty acid desaturase [Rhizobiales bacterium]|nr:fatty acid desaturase [Hyphomicrobiales bacterium]MBI3672253.1 fatty acid desaturase [Hyphomicrobiales bacterium]